MGTLNFNAIYETTKSNMKYILDPQKIVPAEDVMRCMSYIEGSHSEVHYATGYHCSTNPDLAAEQFQQDRDRYWKRKKGKRLKGQNADRFELLAHHIYVSFHKDDRVSIDDMMQITAELIERTPLRDFRSLRAPHNNTDEGHVHISVNAYSMSADKKFCMNHNMLYTLRRELDYICVEHGLSIVEDYYLKKDPEYKAWFDCVKAEGKITIRQPRTLEEKKLSWTEKNKTRNKKKREKHIIEEIADISDYNQKPITAKQWKKDQCTLQSYTNNNFFFAPKKKYYRLKLWSDTGRRRGTIELLFLLISTILFDTAKYEYEICGPIRLNINSELQRSIDAIATARTFGITNGETLRVRIKETGSNMNALKRSIYYIDKELLTNLDSELIAEKERLTERLKSEKQSYRKLMELKNEMNRVCDPKYMRQLSLDERIEKQSVNDLINSAERMKSTGRKNNTTEYER